MRKTTRTSRGLINFRLAFLAILSFWCCALSDTMPMHQNSRQGLESLQLTDNTAMKIVCDPPDSQSLLQILGPAFNARYMSLDQPPDEPIGAGMTTTAPDQNDAMFGIETDDTYSSRRRQMEPRGLKPLPFRVTSNHEQFSPDDGLYNLQVNPMQNISQFLGNRRRRSSSDDLWKSLRRNHYERFTPKNIQVARKPAQPSATAGLPTPPWHCPSRVVWVNLGPSYFPQFVRTIECGKKGSVGPTSCWFGAYECAPSSFTIKILHRNSDYCYPVIENNRTVRFEQKWSFVEKAVPFCCSCQFKLYSKESQASPLAADRNGPVPSGSVPVRRLPIVNG